VSKQPFYPVILAGGSGTRFWPRSRRKQAKQVLALDGKQTMIQKTMERLLPLNFWPEKFSASCLQFLHHRLLRSLRLATRRLQSAWRRFCSKGSLLTPLLACFRQIT
jgi:molybdopterin-guanine dinucleotide biosynthesis protein A